MIPCVPKADRSSLYGPFNAKLDELYARCLARGISYWLLCTNRTWPEQQVEYNKGRNSKGQVVNKKLVVTNAKPGQSLHNFMIATDWCRNFGPADGPLKPMWSIQKPEHYKVLAEEAVKLGLEAGLYWSAKKVDPPHISVNIEAHGLTFRDLQAAHAQGGDKAVLELLDATDLGL